MEVTSDMVQPLQARIENEEEENVEEGKEQREQQQGTEEEDKYED